jgi:hypothetical protein
MAPDPTPAAGSAVAREQAAQAARVPPLRGAAAALPNRTLRVRRQWPCEGRPLSGLACSRSPRRQPR